MCNLARPTDQNNLLEFVPAVGSVKSLPFTGPGVFGFLAQQNESMKHQRQVTRRDCQLATLAMLADQPLASVTALAERYLHSLGYDKSSDWFDLIPEILPDKFDLITRRLAEMLHLSLPIPLNASSWATMAIPMGPSGCHLVLPTGRGQITVLWHGGGAHAMAYADGMVYDPGQTQPLSPIDWWDEWGRCVEGIWITPLTTTR